MRIAITCLAVVVAGCSKSEPNPPAPTALPPEVRELVAPSDESKERFSRMAQQMEKAKAEEEETRKAIAADPEGVLFRKAEEAVLKAAHSSIGNTAAADGVATAKAVEAFGESKWEVTGEYRGPDRDGNLFTSQWTVEFQLFAGRLQTMRTSLGKIVHE